MKEVVRREERRVLDGEDFMVKFCMFSEGC